MQRNDLLSKLAAVSNYNQANHRILVENPYSLLLRNTIPNNGINLIFMTKFKVFCLTFIVELFKIFLTGKLHKLLCQVSKFFFLVYLQSFDRLFAL